MAHTSINAIFVPKTGQIFHFHIGQTVAVPQIGSIVCLYTALKILTRAVVCLKLWVLT